MSVRPGTVVFDQVSKRYRLGPPGTLRGAISDLASRLRGDGRGHQEKLWALRDVSFRVEPGECWGVIGPNGAGKTTALKLLANITQPTSGSIAVCGRASSLIELGAGFHPELTGRENITLNGAILGLRRREIARKMDEIIAFSELEPFIDTPVKRYSSGMYVRLGFSVAAHVEPDVLLVDEVLAVGDASFRQRCIRRMRALQESGTTILLVSHNMHAVRKMCTRAVLLRRGRVCAQGPTADVIEAYETSSSRVGRESIAHGRYAQALAGHLDHSSHVRIDAVEVVPAPNGESGPADPMRSDRPAAIRIQYQSHEPQPIGRIDVRVIREDGTLCSAIDSGQAGDGDGGFERLGSKGEIEVELASLQLTRGRYTVLVQITDVIDATVLASGQSDCFTVFSPNSPPNPGVFVMRSTWRHTTWS